MSTIITTRPWPAPTTDTADMALRMAGAERRIEALATALRALLDQATADQGRAAALGRAALDDVGLPHGGGRCEPEEERCTPRTS
ncbi:hypothetical protein [Dactylosporangium sp. CA-092794]|uniref:hypothetical protein n=1 Tax=Dactylosporangium sp. CA-092794 TaxID=3239929 RepID=UPI003D8F5059